MILDEAAIRVSPSAARLDLEECFVASPCASIDEVRTVIAGHSHSDSIIRALVTKHARGHDLKSATLAMDLGIGGLRGNSVESRYWDILAKLGRSRNLAIVWNGSQYNGDFLLISDRPIDLVPRGYPDTSVVPGARIIAEEMAREHFRASLESLSELLPKLAGQGSCKRLLVGTPPPLFDNALIRKRLQREPSLADRAAMFGLNVDTIGITPASVRRKLWFVLQSVMEEVGSEHGWQFVPTASKSQDPQGYLPPELSDGDVTHANVIYGATMVQQIAACLQH